jgi:hypothetical protein
MGFSAMLAEEYILIGISLSTVVRAERTCLRAGRLISAVYLNFNFGNSIGLKLRADGSRLPAGRQGISAQLKALNVSGHAMATPNIIDKIE